MTEATKTAPTPLLELSGITKVFGETVANDGIDLCVNAGEIHAILGENGAGKSTLMKIISGVLVPDAGTMRWRGEEVVIKSPAHARELGIGMVFQHFSLFETLTVAENISLAMPGTPAELAPRIAAIGERFGLPVDPDASVHSLSIGQKQRVEIIRCLLQEPRLIIMDEPTSVLPPTGVPALFDTIRQLTEQGCAVLFISHKMEEIRSLCHTATVIRGGRYVATTDPMEESADALARLMIGRDIPRAEHGPARPDPVPALSVQGLTLRSDDPFGTHLRDVTFDVRPGEIVGIAGVSGNGQAELAALLSGEARLPRSKADAVRIHGVPAGHLDAKARRALGLAFVPEDRNGRGAVQDLSLEDNALLTSHTNGLVRRGLIQRAAVRVLAEHCISEMRVECAGPHARARSLSGGNLQKFIMGREMLLEPRLMIASQPTWGVDVGAAAAIRRKLIEMRDAGTAILVISEELEELFEIADRLLVMFRGQVSPALDPREADLTTVGSYMTGSFLGEATDAASEVAA